MCFGLPFGSSHGGNPIGTLEWAAKLSKLKTMVVHNAGLTDLSGTEALGALFQFNISDNGDLAFEGTESWPALEILFASNLKSVDTDSLKKMPEL